VEAVLSKETAAICPCSSSSSGQYLQPATQTLPGMMSLQSIHRRLLCGEIPFGVSVTHAGGDLFVEEEISSARAHL